MRREGDPAIGKGEWHSNGHPRWLGHTTIGCKNASYAEHRADSIRHKECLVNV